MDLDFELPFIALVIASISGSNTRNNNQKKQLIPMNNNKREEEEDMSPDLEEHGEHSESEGKDNNSNHNNKATPWNLLQENGQGHCYH